MDYDTLQYYSITVLMEYYSKQFCVGISPTNTIVINDKNYD